MSDSQLFEDTFTITSINSQKYDRVSRISCTSTDNLTTFTLDVNTELYPCAVGESLSLALASTLSLDGKDEDASGGRTGWRDVAMGEHTLANEYDYVCHGKVYRFEEGSTSGNMYVWQTHFLFPHSPGGAGARQFSAIRRLTRSLSFFFPGPFLCRLADFSSTSMAHITSSYPSESTTFIFCLRNKLLELLREKAFWNIVWVR